MTTAAPPTPSDKPVQIPAMDLRKFIALLFLAFFIGLVVGFRLPRPAPSGTESAQTAALYQRLLKETAELKALQLDTQMRMIDCPQGILPEKKPKKPSSQPAEPPKP